MEQLLRTVLIWFVALAVPAQGMAAATMMHCGPTYHGVQAAQPKVQALPDALQAAPETHAAHGHASHAASHARMASDTGQNATSLDASGTAQPDKVTDPVKVTKATYQKCSFRAAPAALRVDVAALRALGFP